LREAARRFFPDGTITYSSLRTEMQKGNLEVECVARKYLVTEAAIKRMLQGSAQCRAQKRDQGSTSATAPAAPPSGLSSTERTMADRSRSAQAAAQMTMQALTKRSPAITPGSTSRRARSPRQNSSSTK
jgi:hypothetical protein